jgi:two-component system alkaline phosphatase synthesis response regulator PhoP
MNATILLVDDEGDFIELLSYNLRNHGYRVLVARNGQQALNKARRYLPDLIVLDLMMSDLDGFTVCEILRCQPSTKNVPIIMLTAMSGQIARYNGLASGANEFLVKTATPSQILHRIERLLADQKDSLLAVGLNGQGFA